MKADARVKQIRSIPVPCTDTDISFLMFYWIYPFFCLWNLKRETMRICRAARSLGCKNMEQGVADNPVEEGRARREVKERWRQPSMANDPTNRGLQHKI